jgi:uncharacterized protein (DUF169 family)
MLSEQAKRVFADLNLPYSAVALKFCRNRPEGYAQAEGVDVFCAYLKRPRRENKAVLHDGRQRHVHGARRVGMTDSRAHGSGQVGAALGVFMTPAPNARLYYDAPS